MLASASALRLQDGLLQLGLDLDPAPFLTYLALLATWNKAYNLTAVRDTTEQVSRHVLDSLAVLPWLHGQRMLDVGSGAGLPGIPLALVRSDVHWVLLDSNGKKVRFLREVKRVLNLKHVDVVQARAEGYRPIERFDTVLSRALSDVSQLLQWTQHVVADDGIWLALKGRDPEHELHGVPNPWRIHPYRVPGVEGERCCVVITR